MVFVESKKATKEFANHRKNKGDEKQETQKFWNSLLQEVFGVKSNEIKKIIDYEKTVKIDTTKYIDGYINDTKVLIEQKSHDIDLNKAEKQSDGAELTPYQQAKRYADNLPHSENPRWIITCNFQEFHIHDMEKEKPQDNPEIVYLKDLPKEYHRLKFIVDSGDRNIKKEMEISIKAGEIVGKLYDSLAPLYKDISNPKSQKSLNVLCVRLVFCLYAEDAGVFGAKNIFHDYLNNYKTEDLRDALIKLFVVLDQKIEERDPYLKDDLNRFPYVNGGLFANEGIEIPNLTDEVRDLLLRQASENFDRSEISPTIFGAVFESTLNPETRRSGGMHYTSIENIHKVIDPLFLDELKSDLDGVINAKQDKLIRERGRALQQKMASLKFLDPACGSGNFLTETYLSLRRIENKIIEKEGKGIARLINPIEVNINQFYGIEINDFAVSVAKTALWIAESQMMNETEEILGESLNFLPLKTNANIIEGNALRMDWNEVISNKECNYIMGNPPFVGHKNVDKEQKEDMIRIFNGKQGRLDFVSARYMLSTKYIEGTNIECAFVSTNSIVQGVHLETLWKVLINHNIHINFAYQSFPRISEATNSANVTCVIIGFSLVDKKDKYLFIDSDKNGNQKKIKVNYINPYLTEEQKSVIVESRNKPLCDVHEMVYGNIPRDGGFFTFETEDEYNNFLKEEPNAKKYIHKFIGSKEYINGFHRYILFLNNITPNELKNMPKVMERVQNVKKFRLSSKAEEIQKFAETPTKFAQTTQPFGIDFIIVPIVSSENRKYIPIGFIKEDIITNNAVQIIPNANIYDFGILTSNVHMDWMRKTASRLENRYRYLKNVVYNNFPRPSPTEEQKKKIEQTAQAILDARNLYPDSSLADLYDELTMPIELRKAHQENDKAVMQAYGFNPKMSESDIVGKLMEMYQKLTKN